MMAKTLAEVGPKMKDELKIFKVCYIRTAARQAAFVEAWRVGN